MVDDATLHALHDELAGEFPDHAEFVLDPLTTVTDVPASFLRHYRLYRVEHMGMSRPFLFYVGHSPDHPVHLLSSDAEDFVALAGDDGVEVESAEQAVEYVRLLIETTRSMSRLTYLVDSVGDLKFRPNLDASEEERRRKVEADLADEVSAPRAEEAADGWRVTAWIVVEQSLERHRFLVRRDGTVERESDTVAGDIPLVYGA